MTLFRFLLAALAISLASIIHAVPAAHAQGTTIIVIDELRIFQESRAGRDIVTKLQNIRTQLDGEVAPLARTVDTLAEALQPKLQGKTPEQISADAAIVAEFNTFQQRRQELAQRQQVVSQEFTLTRQKALADFNTALEPVVLEVMRERGAQIVIEKDMALVVADSVDVSADVISKLDQRTPAIAVTRQRLPAQQQ
ncbi:OmpH family outer membrane protein [Hyphomonas sp.]|uniref:OmpH family outer membrane protein n=1 Tax=Hyphomonas sp. TaxID=87 RepID=UPI003918CE7B